MKVEFNVDDVKKLAQYALDHHVTQNNNGADWCSDCGCDLNSRTGEGHHKLDCITKVAQDVLTGIKD